MNTDIKTDKPIENGTRKEIGGVTKGYYEGYWIKRYELPKNNLSAKKDLIQSLTRRLFNHMEHGINIQESYSMMFALLTTSNRIPLKNV